MYSLADAILEEKIDQINYLLQSGVALNQPDEYGFTPLIEAAITDNIQIAKLIISYGADVNLQDMTGNTPLHWAAENSNLSLCQLLLEKGANANAYNFSGQPVLAMPLLRQQEQLKELLLTSGANLSFAQDYINTKLLGHMFELVGTANIVDPKNHFIEVNFEGFFLEFSLAIICNSLAQFENHFAARRLRRYAHFTHAIVEALGRAAKLIRYQQYRVDIRKHQDEIAQLIQQEPLIIPIGYDGHAITFIKLGTLLVKCDRREDSRLYDNVMIYEMKRSDVLSVEFIKKLIYEKQSGDYVNNELPGILHLEPLTEIKVAAQISGNCSWANVEACIPALFFLLFGQLEQFADVARYKSLALNFFHQWREWNKERSLQFCIQSLWHADSIRKASKAEILAAVLFQSCNSGDIKDGERAQAILRALVESHCDYVIRNYIKSYVFEDVGEEGRRFLQLLKACGYRI